MTSPSQPRNTRTLPLIRARGLKLADPNSNPDDLDDQFNPLQLQGARQDDPTPDNGLQANGAAQDQQPPAPTPGPVNPQASIKTIYDFINEVGNYYKWFAEDQSGLNQTRLTKLNSTTHVETYQRTEDGFQLTVAGSNRTIRWIMTPPGSDGTPAQQHIQGQSDGFDQSDANAMVALSALHGWKRINVHGSERERQLLWYAAMSQGLQVDGYEPDHNSDIYKQWQSEQSKNPDDETAPPLINGGSSTDPSVTPGQTPAPTPTPPVNDNTPPADQQPPAPPAEDEDPDLSGLDKDQLTYLLERYTAEEKYAITQNDPNLKQITRIKEAAAKALADMNAKDAAPANPDKPADATPPPDASKKPADKPAKKTKPAQKSTKPAQDAAPKAPATKDAGAKDAPVNDASAKDPAAKAPAAKDATAKDSAAKDKYAGGKTTGEFNKQAPVAAKPADSKPAQQASAGHHRAGAGRTNAQQVITREQKKAAAPK